MENTFKELEPKDHAPRELEKRVMGSINLAQLAIDLSDLFVVKLGSTVNGLFRTGKNS